MGVVLVTGTGPGVGATTTAAAVAALAAGRVAVVKLVQTGRAPGEPGDLETIVRLSKVEDAHELARYGDALSPHHAAVLAGRPPLVFAEVVRQLLDLDALHDLVLVDGTGGLLEPYDSDERWTLIDLAHSVDAAFVVVTRAGVGTLNEAALTLGAIEEEGLGPPELVIGSWPREPDLAMRSNVADLCRTGRRGALGGVLPAGLGVTRTAGEFRRGARAGLGPPLGGTFDSRAFVTRQRPW